MTGERRDERIDRAVTEAIRREYGRAEAPRDAMWAAIAAEREAARSRPRRFPGRTGALATAAVLALIAVGVHRYAGRLPEAPVAPDPVAEAPAVDPDDLVLRGHLARTGALLDTVTAGAAPGGGDAAPLLALTRVLLDDPALDPPVARLLADAEIALALLVRSNAAQGSAERAVLRESVVEERLSARLLAASGRAP